MGIEVDLFNNVADTARINMQHDQARASASIDLKDALAELKGFGGQRIEPDWLLKMNQVRDVLNRLERSFSDGGNLSDLHPRTKNAVIRGAVSDILVGQSNA